MSPMSRAGSTFLSSKFIGKYIQPKQVTLFIAPLFIVDKKWKQFRHPLTGEWVLKKCISIQYSLTIKRNKVPIHATIWTNLKDIMLNKRTPTQSIAYCMNKFIGNI